MNEEEKIPVSLGIDFERGAFFTKEPGYPRDYLVSRSQMERWKAAESAYEQMQDEIEQVMNEQRERILALRAERKEFRLGSRVERAYGPKVQADLERWSTLRSRLNGERE